MTRSLTAAAKLGDAALDRVLSLASPPQVPAGLADQIAATVTQFAQTVTPSPPAGQARPRIRYALAASLAAVGIAGALALTTYRTASPDTSPEPLIALADPAPVSAAPPVTAVEKPTAVKPEQAFAAKEAPSAKSVPTIAAVELPPASTVEIDVINLAENTVTANPALPASEAAEEPIGPSLAENTDHKTATSAEAPLFGPPAPQGLGIRGGGGGYPALPDAGPSAPRQPGFPGARNRW